MNRTALIIATGIGLALQLAMVVAGHYSPPVKALFAVGGMGFSLVAGLVFAFRARASWPADVGGGAIAGGVCGFLGIAVSLALADVPPSLLVLGTVSSIVAGGVGGAIGKLVFR